MFNIEKAKQSNRAMRAITGLDRLSFESLLLTFSQVLTKVPRKKKRQRAIGGGRKHTLETAEEKLFFILFYMKCYPTFDLAALFYDVDRSQTYRWVVELLPILEKTLDRELVLPKRKITSLEEFMRLFPGVKDIIIDGTERPIQRPSSNKRQKRHYSGKKKRHTKKNIIVATPKKKILIVTPTKAGKKHDKSIFDKSDLSEKIPKDIGVWVDLGFKGIENNLNVAIPHKKPRKSKLTDEQKADNKIISSIRVIGENAIGGIKRMRCVSDVCRNKRDDLKDDFILISSAIWNYHLKTTV